jgi:two-component system, NtrC family, response regulator AtoC
MLTAEENAKPSSEAGRGPTISAEASLRILLVDDDPEVRSLLHEALVNRGHQVFEASTGSEALALLSHHPWDLALLDVRLPGMDGLTLFRRIRAETPDTAVILMTAYGAVQDAVDALREGAYSYVTKPFDPWEFVESTVGRLAAACAVKKALQESDTSDAHSEDPAAQVIGRSLVMRQLLTRLRTVAQSDAPLLILGETGTGKELVARTVHALGTRRAGPFIAVNCAAFPEALLEAELFGHDRGAFTGAIKKRDGRFKAAEGGTLMLDEIAEMSPSAQVKLLRVLEEGTFEPLGTNQTLKADVRIMSATHQDLKDAIAKGKFREDLYYRLNVLDLCVPPLRERAGDLPLLIQYFLRRLTPEGQAPPPLSPRAFATLSEYPFPGNVRELRHAIERALLLSKGQEIELQHLPQEIHGAPKADVEATGLRPLAQAMREFEREYLLRALASTDGGRGRTAELLGISRKNLWEKLKLHGISDADLED